MRHAIGLLLAIPVWFVADPTATAQQSQLDQCINSGTTNYDWAQCGNVAITSAEAKLTTSWKYLSACFDHLDKDGSNADVKAARQGALAEQRLWIKWKDASCGIYGSGYFGREGQVLGFPECRVEIVNQRAAQLDELTKELCNP